MKNGQLLMPDQCRAARALIGWSRRQLSEQCSVSASTIEGFEVGRHVTHARTLADLKRALEAAGVVFISADPAGGAGVRRSAIAAKTSKG